MSPLDHFTRSGISWFRGISMRLAEELIELGLKDLRSRGEAASEDLATAALLFDWERRRLQSTRTYAERWGWSKSSVHRLMQRLGVQTEKSVGRSGTGAGQRGTTSGRSGTDVGHAGTEPPQNRLEYNSAGTAPGHDGTDMGHSRDSLGQVRDSPYSEIQKYQNTEEYPLPPPRTREETRAFGAMAGIPTGYCDYFFDHYAPAWRDRDDDAVTDWTQRLQRWWRKDAQHWRARDNAHGAHRHDNDSAESRATRAAEAAADNGR